MDIIYNVLLNDKSDFEEAFINTRLYTNSRERWCFVKDFPSLLNLLNRFNEDVQFRLWVHPKLLNSGTQDGANTIISAFQRDSKTCGLEYVFISRKREGISDNTYKINNVIVYPIDLLNSEDFSELNIPCNIPQKSFTDFLVSKDSNQFYIAGDYKSAISKAKEVVRQVKKISKEDLNGHIALLSIGGGNGVELLYLCEKLRPICGVLFDFSLKSVQKFNEEYSPVFCKQFPNVKLLGFSGDATDFKHLEGIKDISEIRNSSMLVISINALLHELSQRTRQKNTFSLSAFLKKIYDMHDNVILVIREPGMVENWPDVVTIEIDNEHFDKFAKIAKYMERMYYQSETLDVYTNSIRISKNIAIESFIKFFYYDDFESEIYEQICSVSREIILKDLKKANFNIIKTSQFYTGSFEKFFEQFKITAYDEEGIPLPLPICFSFVIATKGKA